MNKNINYFYNELITSVLFINISFIIKDVSWSFKAYYNSLLEIEEVENLIYYNSSNVYVFATRSEGKFEKDRVNSEAKLPISPYQKRLAISFYSHTQ